MISFFPYYNLAVLELIGRSLTSNQRDKLDNGRVSSMHIICKSAILGAENSGACLVTLYHHACLSVFSISLCLIFYLLNEVKLCKQNPLMVMLVCRSVLTSIVRWQSVCVHFE